MIDTGMIIATAEVLFDESIMHFHYPKVWGTLGFDHFRAYDEPILFDDIIPKRTKDMVTKKNETYGHH